MRRPDVRLAERRLAAATARIGLATADLHPRVSPTGLYGGAAADIGGLAAERSLTWGVGPSIRWTLPNQAGPRARIRQAKAAAAATLARFDGAMLQALRETEQTLAVYDSELDHPAALAEADDRARRALSMTQDQVEAGAASTLDQLTAGQSLIGADAALAQDQIAVFKALGGGWRTAARTEGSR